MFQRVILAGRVGSDPDLKYLGDGRAICSFSLAVDYYHDKERRSMWFRVSTFEKTAEQVSKYLKKGRQALVEGRLTPDPNTGAPRVYEKKDGGVGSSFDIVASQVVFLGTKEENEAVSVKVPPKRDDPDGDEFMVF